jgi:hypothetical protein
MIIFAIQFLHVWCPDFILRQAQSKFAGVVKLVDTLDLGSSASRCEGSSPFARTAIESRDLTLGFFIWGNTWVTQIERN